MSAGARLARRGLKLAAGTADRLRARPRGVVVLIYHRVGGGSSSEVDLSESLFDAQMAELAASGRVTTLDDALAALVGPAPSESSHDPVVVTFDDGTADFADHGVPVLQRHRIPATLYLATAFVEEQRPFPGDATPLSWGALRDAAGTGLVDVGSHTHTHALLDRVTATDAVAELERSVGLVEERLGRPCRHFAYPKAVAGSPAAHAAVRARFVSAALAGTRANPYGATDVHRLARSPVQRSDGMRWFRAKVDGGMAAEDAVRRTLNRLRYRGRST